MRGVAVVVAATAVVVAAGGVAGARAGGAGAGGAPEADLAFHGRLWMDDGRVELRMTPQNHGPVGVDDATVRLRWSAPLADEQRLPAGCARSGARAVLCRTGALPADGWGRTLTLAVRLRGEPGEVTMGIDAVWGGGAVDRNHRNDRREVLVLDTGDSYAF
ncbi:hypothetical protein [Streptomyces liliiviolaceus]|uniref:hypothetical protein n=1 Tax=Streptomyces liliiviolaceus TaxID=2823109 RepID=UPI001FFCC3AB|nr:hypothetical protein [Streptomyces liliiviolaceus]